MKTMKKPFYIVNAFGTDTFNGNPAGICWTGNDQLSEHQMQAIAAEVNLSNIAFITYDRGDFQENDTFGIRWFSPTKEITMNGHATLSAAHTLYEKANNRNERLTFRTSKEDVTVKKEGDLISLEFLQSKPESVPDAIFSNLLLAMFTSMERGCKIADVRLSKRCKVLLIRMTDDYSRKDLERLSPDFIRMKSSHDGSLYTGVVVTAKGKRSDGYHFYSRFFSPWSGINEEPVSVLAHSILAPFWQGSMGKREMVARQCSKRGGDVTVSVRRDDMVEIRGTACTVVDGVITIPDIERKDD